MTRIHDFSESYEMYLKTVAELREGDSAIPITAVAERLGVATVSASEMVHRLADHGLLLHQPYKGVFLTDDGISAAEAVVRAHRLWECFLVENLEVDWSHAHELACDLEHATSADLVAGLDAFLGYPTRCPHGNRIPREGDQATSDEPRLADLEAGSKGRISSIRPESTQVLIALSDRGLLPEVEFMIEEIELFDGPRQLQTEGGSVTLGRRLAEHVRVEVIQ